MLNKESANPTLRFELVVNQIEQPKVYITEKPNLIITLDILS